jgi:CRP-like cAMP-binding protein
VVGDLLSTARNDVFPGKNEHTAIAKTNEVFMLRFDVELSRKYPSCNGIFDSDALCYLLRQPAASRSSSDMVALCNLMETVSFFKVIPPNLMFEWCRLLELATFEENDILQEQNSFQFSDFAVFVVISGLVVEHAQPDTQDPDFSRFKEVKENVLPFQKDIQTAKALITDIRNDCFGPIIRSMRVGEVFGDRGILSKRCRQSTVIADSQIVRCIKITRKKFMEFAKLMPSLAAQPDVVWQLMQTHPDRRTEQEKGELVVQLQRLPAFSALPLDVIADVAGASRGGLFNFGDVVFPVDDENRYFGIILEGEMASFSRDESALKAFPGMQVAKIEDANKTEQERLKLMQQRYGLYLQKFSHGSIIGVGALWHPEISCVARLDNAAEFKGKSLQNALSEGVPTVFETVAAKGSRMRRTMSFVSLTKGLQVIIVDSHALLTSKSILKNSETFFPSQLLAAIERPPHLRNAYDCLSLTAYLLSFKYCQRLPLATVSDLAKHFEASYRKKGECIQRQGARPHNFFMLFKGSASLFRVPPPPLRDDDEDDDETRFGASSRSQCDQSFEEGRPNTRSRVGSPNSKGMGSRYGGKSVSPSPPRTAALIECAVPSTADTEHGSSDDIEDFAGIFGDKIGAVGVGASVDELALVVNALSPFSAVITSPFARLFTLNPDLYAKILRRFHRDELSRLCKQIAHDVPVFRSWTLPKLMNLVRYFEPKEYFRGQRIMSQVHDHKNEHRRIVLVLEGSCAVEAEIPHSADHCLESEIKQRQKDELEEESLRLLNDDKSYKDGIRKARQIRRAVITMFGKNTILLDGFAAQPLSYDIVAIESVSCLELSGEEFSKVNNAALEYIAEQEAMTNSWRSTVVAKLAVIRAPNFSLNKIDPGVDIDSIIDAINSKKISEQRSAKNLSRSPQNKNRRSPERLSGAAESLGNTKHPVSSKVPLPPSFGQRSITVQASSGATLVSSTGLLQEHSQGLVQGSQAAIPPLASSFDSKGWWAAMGIEGMADQPSHLVQQKSRVVSSSANDCVGSAVDTAREFARANFGVKVRIVISQLIANLTLTSDATVVWNKTK